MERLILNDCRGGLRDQVSRTELCEAVTGVLRKAGVPRGRVASLRGRTLRLRSGQAASAATRSLLFYFTASTVFSVPFLTSWPTSLVPVFTAVPVFLAAFSVSLVATFAPFSVSLAATFVSFSVALPAAFVSFSVP